MKEHAETCRCPICKQKREGGPGAPVRTVRLTDEVWAWMMARPEGPRGWIEQKVREEQEKP